MQNREEDFQEVPVDIHLVLEDQEVLVDLVVIHPDHQDFLVDVQAVSNLDFRRVRDRLVDILADVPLFHFQEVSQRAGRVQVDIHQVQVVHQAGRVHDQEDFQQDQVLGILVADLVDQDFPGKDRPDIRAVDPDKKNQEALVIPVDDLVDKDRMEDILVAKLLEVIPAEVRNLVAREVDILVEGPVLAIQEVVRDLAVVQVLKDQADIQDREVLEVNQAQVERLVEVIQADQEHKDQEVIRVVQVRKDPVAIPVDHKVQEATQVSQAHKVQEATQVGQAHKDQEEVQVGQVRKDQDNSQ